jgi:hypothetical protein
LYFANRACCPEQGLRPADACEEALPNRGDRIGEGNQAECIELDVLHMNSPPNRLEEVRRPASIAAVNGDATARRPAGRLW